MIRISFLYLILVLLCSKVTSQNMQVLYDFDQLPQTLLLNPGTEIDYDKHFGVPLLSNVYGVAGSSSRDVTYNNLVVGADDNGDIGRNLFELGLSKDDIFLFHQEIEVFNVGFRLKDPTYYLSFGMYQQTDGYSLYPKDFAYLYFNGDLDADGNTIYDTYYNADQVTSVFDVIGVFHIGVNKRLNEKLRVGARFKLLSGSVGLQTGSNTGTYNLERNLSLVDPYLHNYEGMGVRLNTSGLLNAFDLSTVDIAPSDIFSGLFFMNGSYGAAIDLGFTYKASDELSFTGSLLDIGMISFSQTLANIYFEDAEIPASEPYSPTQGNELNYWRELFLNQELPMYTEEVSYNYFRAPRLNLSAKHTDYRKSRVRNTAFRNVNCDYDYDAEVLESAYGLQIYTAFRPKIPMWAVTGFYSRELTSSLAIKGTYTVDQFSYYNLGFGISGHIKHFNIYATADNLVALASIKNSNYQSFQFGMNFIF